MIGQSFAQSRKTYGCLRVRQDLQQIGQCCGKNRVLRLMRAQGLRPRQKRRFRPCTTDSRHPYPIADNWLAKVPAVNYGVFTNEVDTAVAANLPGLAKGTPVDEVLKAIQSQAEGQIQ